MDESNTREEAKEVSFGVPAAIVIAGIIIAGAIIFTNRDGAEPLIVTEPYVNLAKQVGVDVKDFQACMESNKFDGVIDRDSINAFDTGGTGTPWTLVVTKQGSVFPISGAQSYDVVKQVIDLAIADAKAGKVTAPEDAKLQNYRPVDETDHILGNKDALVSVIEYSDYQCPFCKNFHPTVKRALAEYGDDINWVYRHFPLETIHPEARPMAHAAECVADLKGNEAFWQFSDLLFGLK